MASASARRTPSREPTPSALTIHNVVVGGHRTSVRLEPLMWDSLRDIARHQKLGINELVTIIERRRGTLSLTAAIRVYIVEFYRSAANGGGGQPATPRRHPLPA